MFSWFRRARKTRPTKPNRAPKRDSRKLRFERVEDRRVMAGFFSGVFDDIVFDDLPVLEQLKAEGSIVYDAANKRVIVEGTEQYNDRVSMVYDTRGTATTADDQLSILLGNINSPLVQAYNFADVSEVVVYTYGGSDTIENNVTTKLRAYAGAGNDTIIGGFGFDVLLGGPDNDYIDGRRGDDQIWGEAGVDALFGDDGIDLILGGADGDVIHGGNGIDSLFGEGGNDTIFGGAGLDTITDNIGTNQKFADYGTNTSTIVGFQRFDWFDKNMQNPDLRSAARLVYRDNFLMRDDMLKLFKVVSSDNYVNTSELADLKDLLSTQLTTPIDTRFFLGKVVNGDRANGWYHGNTLGNLFDGASGLHLTRLVDKWFLGGDLPRLEAGTNATYRKVSGQLFVSGPTFDDIDQGGDSDCYFLAALGEVAQHKPSLLQNMFISNGDGTFTVRFFKGSSSFFVTVNSFLPVNNNSTGAQFAGWGGGSFTSAGNELWVALAEKAYAQLNESGWIGQDGVNSYPGIDFGWPADAFSHLSGKSATNRNFSMYPYTDPMVKNMLLNDINGGKAIVVATKDGGTDADVVGNHAYQLVGYNATTDRFELRNPHGANGSKPVQLFLSFAQLKKNCTQWTAVSL